MGDQFSPLNEIDESRTDWQILLMINRKWRNTKGYESPEDADLHCVGIDRDGMQIHIEIDRELVDTYINVLHEGGIYVISHFYVNPVTTYEPVTRSNKIEFMMGTTAVEYGGPQLTFPEQNFDFIDFDEIANYLGDRQFLLDVIGFLHGITDEVSSHTRFGDAPITNLVLLNSSMEKLNLTLWGSCSTAFNNLHLTRSDQPIVLIVTSLIVKRISGIYRVSSTNATKAFVNINHETVQNFFNSFPGKLQPPLLLPPENFSNQPKAQQEMTKLVTVTQLLALPRNNVRDRQFRTVAQITDIERENGWFYDGCPECLKKSKGGVTIVACSGCPARNTKVVPIYKLEATISDGNQKAIAIFFTRAAEQLVGYPIQHVRKLEFTTKSRLPQIIKNLRKSKWELQVGVNTKSLNMQKLVFNVNRVIRRVSLDEPSNLPSLHAPQTVYLLKNAPETHSLPPQAFPNHSNLASGAARQNQCTPRQPVQPPQLEQQAYNSTPAKRPWSTYQRRPQITTPPTREGNHPMKAANTQETTKLEGAATRKGKSKMTDEEYLAAEKQAKKRPYVKRKLSLGGPNIQRNNLISQNMVHPVRNNYSDEEVNNYSLNAPESHMVEQPMSKPLQVGNYTIMPRPISSMQPISNFTKNPHTLPQYSVPQPELNIQPAHSGNTSPQPLKTCIAESVGETKTSYEKLVEKETKEIRMILAQEDWENLLAVGYTDAEVKEAELYLQPPEDNEEIYHTPGEEKEKSSPKTPSN